MSPKSPSINSMQYIKGEFYCDSTSTKVNPLKKGIINYYKKTKSFRNIRSAPTLFHNPLYSDKL